jgi:hypothetical protein
MLCVACAVFAVVSIISYTANAQQTHCCTDVYALVYAVQAMAVMQEQLVQQQC